MKKQLMVLAATLVAGSVLAQGTLTLNNANPIVLIDGVPAASAAGAKVQFVWALPGDSVSPYVPGVALTDWLSANPALRLESLVVPVGTPLPGRFFGGTITVNTPTPGADIMGWLAGWAGSATSFDAAFGAAAPVGVSASFAVNTGNPLALPAPEAPGDILAVQPFSLAVIPEPTTFALVGMGLGALLIFRRRS
jgi:hypothetical protein